MIAFAGQAVVKCPLTVDYDSFRRSLAELDPGAPPAAEPRSATRFASAEVFDAQGGRDQAIC